MDVHYGYFGRALKTGKPPAAATGSGLKNALDHGAQMAFKVDADGKGYVQEIAIPWKLLASEGTPAPRTGESVGFTVEPNFSIGISGRLTLKDIFRSGVTLERQAPTSGARPTWWPRAMCRRSRFASRTDASFP